MRRVFADTSFYIALIHAKDAHHGPALQWSAEYDGITFTTEYVLIETANYFCQSDRKPAFTTLMDMLAADEDSFTIPSSPDLFNAGVALYRKRPDKNWSLTDCISFVVMQEHDIADALTCDRHFGQAGFGVLLSR